MIVRVLVKVKFSLILFFLLLTILPVKVSHYTSSEKRRKGSLIPTLHFLSGSPPPFECHQDIVCPPTQKPKEGNQKPRKKEEKNQRPFLFKGEPKNRLWAPVWMDFLQSAVLPCLPPSLPPTVASVEITLSPAPAQHTAFLAWLTHPTLPYFRFLFPLLLFGRRCNPL